MQQTPATLTAGEAIVENVACGCHSIVHVYRILFNNVKWPFKCNKCVCEPFQATFNTGLLAHWSFTASHYTVFFFFFVWHICRLSAVFQPKSGRECWCCINVNLWYLSSFTLPVLTVVSVAAIPTCMYVARPPLECEAHSGSDNDFRLLHKHLIRLFDGSFFSLTSLSWSFFQANGRLYQTVSATIGHRACPLGKKRSKAEKWLVTKELLS